MSKRIGMYQYTILLQPSDDGKDKGMVLVPLTAITAGGDREARIVAERAIPEANLADLDRVEVIVRPFG